MIFFSNPQLLPEHLMKIDVSVMWLANAFTFRKITQ